jgi:hypothetical protein
MCRGVLQILRGKVVHMVAGRRVLADMDKPRDSVDAFTALVMKEVSSTQTSHPPKAFMNEIRGDVLKEALLAKYPGG